jgi:hypothetical protein
MIPLGSWMRGNMKKLIAVVLIADGTPDNENEVISLEGIKIPEEPVSVRQDYDVTRPVGRAKLHLEGVNLVADVELLDRIEGEYTFAIGGSVKKKTKREDGVVVLNEIQIDTLGLCEKRNSDDRIKPIKI